MSEETKQPELELPERIRRVQFTENVRLASGLMREVQSALGRVLFLEKGCLVVREYVGTPGGARVETVAIPLNSGLVRHMNFEDEVLETAPTEPGTTPEAAPEVGEQPAVHPGGLEPVELKLLFHEAQIAEVTTPAAAPHPGTCECGGSGVVWRQVVGEENAQPVECPGATKEPVAVSQSTRVDWSPKPAPQDPPAAVVAPTQRRKRY